jgi:hypothetical protein
MRQGLREKRGDRQVLRDERVGTVGERQGL